MIGLLLRIGNVKKIYLFNSNETRLSVKEKIETLLHDFFIPYELNFIQSDEIMEVDL